jgi:hypothetical protein
MAYQHFQRSLRSLKNAGCIGGARVGSPLAKICETDGFIRGGQLIFG